MPPPAGGEGMTGNRVPRFRHTVHIGRWRTGPPTNTLPGVHIMRHSEPASWPSPLRGSTFRSSLDPDPSLAFVCTEPGTRTDQSQTPWPRGVDRPRSFRDDQRPQPRRRLAGQPAGTTSRQPVEPHGEDFVRCRRCHASSPPFAVARAGVLSPAGSCCPGRCRANDSTVRFWRSGPAAARWPAQLLATRPRLRMTVTDFDEAMVAAARVRLARFADRANVRQADSTGLSLPDSQSITWCSMMNDTTASNLPSGNDRPVACFVGYDLVASH